MKLFDGWFGSAMQARVILSGAPEECSFHLNEGREVEGSRMSALCHTISGSSPRAASRELPEAAFKLQALSGSFDSPRSHSSLGFAQDDSVKAIHAIRLTCMLMLLLFFSAVFLQSTQADAKPAVQLNVEKAAPREISDTVQQALVRDYSAAWQALGAALADNNAGALNDSFIGFAQDQLTQRIKDQQHAGLTTRIIDHGHQVEAIFYSTEGAAVELRDTATLETQVLDGNTVIHSERAQLRYYVIMTGAEDRWKVRVMESSPGQE